MNDFQRFHVKQLIKNIDSLLEDLKVSEPIYDDISVIAQNPIIELISKSMNCNPFWYAKTLNEGNYVTFDEGKITETKNKLQEMIS